VAKTENEKTPVVNILNPKFDKQAEINSLSEDIRAEIAAGRLVAEKTDVVYTVKATKAQHKQFFLRVLPAETIGEGDKAVKVSAEDQLAITQKFIVTDVAEQVKYMLAGKDSSDRLSIRTAIVNAVEGSGKAIEKAETATKGLVNLPGMTAEKMAQIQAILEGVKAEAAKAEAAKTADTENAA
jgi:hypothetical protein